MHKLNFCQRVSQQNESSPTRTATLLLLCFKH
jgi:hypothetical protein